VGVGGIAAELTRFADPVSIRDARDLEKTVLDLLGVR